MLKSLLFDRHKFAVLFVSSIFLFSLSATSRARENPLAATPKKTAQDPLETAILAGGCFWGMEEVFRKIPGVVSTEVGYTGGTQVDPKYEEVSTSATGHAESIRIQYDPKKTSYADLLKIFFRAHNPTTMNRQGNDRGTQYRSAIFIMNSKQKSDAEAVIKKVDDSKKWDAPVVTKIEKATEFYPAEKEHQKYLVKNPNGYNDHFLRDFNFD